MDTLTGDEAASVERVKAKAKRPTTFDYLDVPEPFLRKDHPEDIEKLAPELRHFLREGPMGMSLMHPLHYQVFGGILWKLANDTFEYKTKAVEEAMDRRDIYKVLMLHERPWRLPKLEDLWNDRLITIGELQDVLPHMWTDTENPRQYGRVPLRMFRAAGFVHDQTVDLDTLDEYGFPKTKPLPNEDVLAKLPPILTIYRGTGTGEAAGLAWSTDKGIASWFARRFREENPDHRLARVKGTGRPLLLQGKVKRADVLGWFTGRGEHEVVVDPKKVKGPHPIALVPLKAAPREMDL